MIYSNRPCGLATWDIKVMGKKYTSVLEACNEQAKYSENTLNGKWK